jgi:hypothetical protein
MSVQKQTSPSDVLESSKVSTTPLLIGAGRLSCMMSELTQRVPLMARH